MNLNLVPLRPEHMAGAAAVFNHYVALSTATFQVLPMPTEELTLELFPGDPRCSGLALLNGQTVVGYGALVPFKGRCGYARTLEVTIFLAPEVTGRGWGEKLVGELERHAQAQNIHCLIAVICAENEASKKLFARMGYEETGLLREVGHKFGRYLDIVYYQKCFKAPEPE